MIFTEHVAWHDGTELAAGLESREKGTRWQLDNVERVLESLTPLHGRPRT